MKLDDIIERNFRSKVAKIECLNENTFVSPSTLAIKLFWMNELFSSQNSKKIILDKIQIPLQHRRIFRTQKNLVNLSNQLEVSYHLHRDRTPESKNQYHWFPVVPSFAFKGKALTWTKFICIWEKAAYVLFSTPYKYFQQMLSMDETNRSEQS